MTRNKACATGFLGAAAMTLSIVLVPSVAYAEEGDTSRDAAQFTLEAAIANQLEFGTADERTSPQTSIELGSAVRLATLNGEKMALVDTSLLEKGSLAAAGQGFVDLSWEAVPGRAYVIFRDNELIAKTDGASYRDTQFSAGTVHHYRIETVGVSGTVQTEARGQVPGSGVSIS